MPAIIVFCYLSLNHCWIVLRIFMPTESSVLIGDFGGNHMRNWIFVNSVAIISPIGCPACSNRSSCDHLWDWVLVNSVATISAIACSNGSSCDHLRDWIFVNSVAIISPIGCPACSNRSSCDHLRDWILVNSVAIVTISFDLIGNVVGNHLPSC